jgi:DNA primase
MTSAIRWILLLMVLAAPVGDLLAVPPEEPAKKSIDDALLDDLDNELLKGAGDLKQRTSPPRDGAAEKGESAGEPASDDTPAGPDPQQDPLGYISQSMREIEQLVPDRKQQKLTEELQKRVVADLDALIEQAQKQQQQQQASQSQNQRQTSQRQSIQQPRSSGSSSTSSQPSSKPTSDSSSRLHKAEQARPDPELLRGLMKDAWGHLPQRDREQMRQVAPERFLPQYELMIERYYRRLAEERAP